MTSSKMTSSNWTVYIILCTDDSLYTGITTDMERRLLQHSNLQGAKYFRGRKPQMLVYLESGHTRSTASKRELEIKRLKRREKQQLLQSANNELDPLLEEILPCPFLNPK